MYWRALQVGEPVLLDAAMVLAIISFVSRIRRPGPPK